MPRPPGRKAASELEVKIAAGDTSVVGELVDLLDEPLHRHLCVEFPALLSLQDREDLVMGFIADLVEDPTKYNKDKASLPHFARLCVKRKAIDLLRRRDTQKQYELGPGTAAVLSLAGSSPLDDIEFSIAVERAKVALDDLDPKYRAALSAYLRHGRGGYKSALVAEFGVTPDAAATWLTRAIKMLRAATGLEGLKE